MSDEKEDRPTARFVAHLPDLITAEDYAAPPGVKKVRVRITITEEGVEILSDSPYPALLEALLAQAGVEEVEKVLCG
jgi:hypothetical protein